MKMFGDALRVGRETLLNHVKYDMPTADKVSQCDKLLGLVKSLSSAYICFSYTSHNSGSFFRIGRIDKHFLPKPTAKNFIREMYFPRVQWLTNEFLPANFRDKHDSLPGHFPLLFVDFTILEEGTIELLSFSVNIKLNKNNKLESLAIVT